MSQWWLLVGVAVGTLLLANAIAACMAHARGGRIRSKLEALARRTEGGTAIPVTVRFEQVSCRLYAGATIPSKAARPAR
jgi:hypothetical protein